MRTDTFFPIPALYQISEKCGSAIIDAQAAIDFTQLKALFLNSSVTKVMHSCSEDLEVIQVQFSIVPESLIDTQLAQAFVANLYLIQLSDVLKDIVCVSPHNSSVAHKMCTKTFTKWVELTPQLRPLLSPVLARQSYLMVYVIKV